MNCVKATAMALWTDEEGLTVVEYAIAGGLIGAAVIAAFVLLGGQVGSIITYLYNQLGQSPGA